MLEAWCLKLGCCVYTHVCMCVHIRMCVCVSVCVTVHAHVCVCMSVYLCMSVCVCAHACMSMGEERSLSVTLQNPEQDLPGGCAFSVAAVSGDHLQVSKVIFCCGVGGAGLGQRWK